MHTCSGLLALGSGSSPPCFGPRLAETTCARAPALQRDLAPDPSSRLRLAHDVSLGAQDMCVAVLRRLLKRDAPQPKVRELLCVLGLLSNAHLSGLLLWCSGRRGSGQVAQTQCRGCHRQQSAGALGCPAAAVVAVALHCAAPIPGHVAGSGTLAAAGKGQGGGRE